MRPTRCWAARAGSATSSSSTARWSGRAAAARRRNAARAPAPRAAGGGTGTCPEPRAWSRRELPLTRHNNVDINALCQSYYRGDQGRTNGRGGGTGKAQSVPRERGTHYRTASEQNVTGEDHGAHREKNHAVPVVRYAGRRGGELLRFRVQEFEDRQDQPLWKRGIRGSRQEGRNGDDRGVRNRRAKVPGPERRAAFQVQRGGVVPGAL